MCSERPANNLYPELRKPVSDSLIICNRDSFS